MKSARISRWLAGALVALLALPAVSDAGVLGKGLRPPGRSPVVKPTVPARPGPSLRERDQLQHRRTPPRPLPDDRTVFRFTTKERALGEARRGLPPETHMTARGGPGRPMTPDHARQRWGLPKTPEVRETIRLPKRTPVQPHKALGGERGAGTLTSPKRLPPSVIKDVTPLHQSPARPAVR